jgi:hypothetical protein
MMYFRLSSLSEPRHLGLVIQLARTETHQKSDCQRRDGIVSCPPTHGNLCLFLIPVKSFDPIPLSLDALKGGKYLKDLLRWKVGGFSDKVIREFTSI